MTRRLVYSALMGGNEAFCEQPVATSSDVDFAFLTDDPELTSDTWRIHYLPARYATDSVRSARLLKILGPPASIGQYDETLWIDNRVVLKRDPGALFDEMLDGSDFTLPLHDMRASVADEFDAVLDKGFDDPKRVREQADAYRRYLPETLEARPFWTAILFRRSTPEVADAMRYWMDDVLRYSRRDQLSIRAAVARAGVVPRGLDIVNRESDWHEWKTRESVGRNEVSASWARSGFRYPLATQAGDSFRALQLRDRAKATVKKLVRKS